MKQNVVFLTVLQEDKNISEISIKTWEHWCNINNTKLFIYNNPQPEWQKWFDVFDQLDEAKIEYNKIFMVDSNTMIKWDAPNIFELTDDKLASWRDMDDLREIYDSVLKYKPIFNDFNLDLKKYINCNNVIINKNHKKFIKNLKEFYENNSLEDKSEQTPLNYLLQINNISINLDIPFNYNARNLIKKELFSYNWQLEQLGISQDKTPHFIKHCYIWRFTGMPKDQKTNLINQVWNFIKDKYIDDDIEFLLNKVRHKGNEFKNATSRKFKRDILKYFQEDGKNQQILELGCCHGDTSRIFSEVFKKVYATDINESNINITKQKCKDCSNIEFDTFKCGEDKFTFNKNIDVVFVDARHSYSEIKEDMLSVLNYFNNPTIIMDDYGNPNNGIRDAIEEIIQSQNLEIVGYIGEDKGFKTIAGWSMVDREGVILKKACI
tara:strand:+ start:719 stop:2026 length:1308 start_codon:yes stop_codon:yes gene_type:complete